MQLLRQIRPVDDGNFADENSRVEKPRHVAQGQDSQSGGVVPTDEFGRRQSKRNVVSAAVSSGAVEVLERNGEGAGKHEEAQEVGDKPEVRCCRVAVVRNYVEVEDAGLDEMHQQQQGAVHHMHHAPPLEAAQCQWNKGL